MTNETFRHELRKYRQRNELVLHSMGWRMGGITATTIGKWEKGTMPGIKTFPKVVEKLRVLIALDNDGKDWREVDNMGLGISNELYTEGL